MRINKKSLFLTLFSFFVFFPFADLSAQGWLYVAEAPANTKWRPNDVIETPKQEFLISYWDYDKTSTIIKLSPEGVLQSSRAITAPDTTIIISKLFFDKDSSVFTAVGLCIPTSGEKEAMLTLKFDENLSILHRNVVSCTGLSRPILNMTILKHNHSYKMAFTETDFSHDLAKFSLEGELQQWQRLEIDSLRTICNLFEIIENDEHFGVFANISNNSYASMGVLVFDDSLNLIKRTHFPQWEHLENNGCISYNYLYDNFNSMIISNMGLTGYLISARLRESLVSPYGQIIKRDHSSIIAKTDMDFAMHEEYHIIERFNDTVETPAFYKSIDYYSPSSNSHDKVYHCCMLGTATDEGWPNIPSTVIVTQIDEDFNIIWKKRVLSGEAYSPFVITATSDGGCIIVGWVFDFNLEERFDLFALKINADGTVGLDEIQEESMAFVYPNPVKETIRIGGIEAKETVVYNTLGQCVMNFRGNEANVEALVGGIYLLKVTDIDNKTQTLRVVIDK